MTGAWPPDEVVVLLALELLEPQAASNATATSVAATVTARVLRGRRWRRGPGSGRTDRRGGSCWAPHGMVGGDRRWVPARPGWMASRVPARRRTDAVAAASSLLTPRVVPTGRSSSRSG